MTLLNRKLRDTNVRSSNRGRLRQAFQENEWVYLVVGLMVGLLLWPLMGLVNTAFGEFLENLVPEAVGIIFTVLIIDRLDSIRENRLIKDQLLRQMHSYYNPTALQSVEELRVLGYLEDGSLNNLDLRGADLRDANLYQADLRSVDLRNAKLSGADFYEANLEGAQVTHEQLRQSKAMRSAIMPDGTRYDGRYNLQHDFEVMHRKGFKTDDDESIAEYYGVSLDEFRTGQLWAAEHPADIRTS